MMCPIAPFLQDLVASYLAGFQAFLNQPVGGGSAVKEESPQAAAFAEAICAHLGGRAPNTPATDAKVRHAPL